MIISAGILPYRYRAGVLQVLLVHPGGPLWQNRDLGSWGIAKGIVEQGEDLQQAARREFREETGVTIGEATITLAPLRQKSGKIVHAWAVEQDIDAVRIQSNTFSMEWPPRSGAQREFPEVDRAQWFTITEAFERMLPGQRAFLADLAYRLAYG
ncbi:MAG: NUDIX domain-containing protein [Casimicrobiaceae bacterium]